MTVELYGAKHVQVVCRVEHSVGLATRWHGRVRKPMKQIVVISTVYIFSQAGPSVSLYGWPFDFHSLFSGPSSPTFVVRPRTEQWAPPALILMTCHLYPTTTSFPSFPFYLVFFRKKEKRETKKKNGDFLVK